MNMMNTVVFGRGGASIHNPANIRYRELVRSHQRQYVAYDDSRHMKTLLSQDLVNEWYQQSPLGRFVKKDETTGLWHDVGAKEARRKTAQLLREGAKKIRKELVEESVSGNTDTPNIDVDVRSSPSLTILSRMVWDEATKKAAVKETPPFNTAGRASLVDLAKSKGLVSTDTTISESLMEPLAICSLPSIDSTGLLSDLKDIVREEPKLFYSYGTKKSSLEMVETFFEDIFDESEMEETPLAPVNL